MYDEPDIVKMLRGEEKLGTFQSSLPSPSEEFEVQEKPSEDAHYESDDFAKDTVKTNTTDRDVSSSSAEKEKIAVALRESEERYKALFNSSFELVYLHDFKGNFIDANPVAFKLLGYNKEELGSLNFSSLLDKGQFWKAIKTIKEIKKYGRQKEPTEYRLKTKNGTFVDIETTAEMVYRNGKPYAVQGIARDITERKKAEQSIKESEEKYRRLFDSSPDLICETDDKGNVLAANSNMTKSMGVPPEKLIGKNIFDILPRETAEERAKIARKALEEMKNLECDDERAGRYFRNIYVPIINPDGKRTIQLIARDVTAAKKAEEALRDGEEKWVSLTRNTNDIIMMVDSQGIIQYISKTLPPYTPKETIGKTIYEYVPKDHHDIMSNSLTKVFKTGEQDNYEVSSNIPKIGTMWFSTKVIPVKRDGAVRNVILISTDTTERKRMEKRLRETEECFRIAAETSNDAMYEWDMQHSIQWFGKIDEMLGYGPGEFPRTFDAWTDLVHPEDKKRVAAAVQAHLDGRIPYAIEYRVLTKDGACRWWTARGAVARTPDGHPIRWIGTVTDITERKKAEKEVIESEEKLKRILDSSPDAITVTDLNGNIIECNQATSMMHGFKKKELIGKNALELFSPKDLERAKEGLKKTLELESVKNLEYTLVTKDGREFPAELSACIIRDASGNPLSFVAITKDITERKTAEEHIKKQNEFVEMVINSLQYPLYVTDKDYNIVLSNKAAKEKGMVDGGRCYQLTHHSQEPCSDEHICPLKEVFRTGKSIVTEHIHFDNDGNSRNFDVHGDPIFDKDGQVIQMIEYSIDITERKKAEEALQESKELHRILFESSHDAIMTLEPPSWKFTTGNPAMIKMFKAKNEAEFISYGPEALSPARQPDGRDSAEKAKEMIETAMREGSCFFEWTHKRIDGEDFPATVLLSRVKMAGKIFLQATVRDMTVQKRAEDERKQAEKELKEKIEELERYKKLTVDRELKMMELKEQIKKLEEKLKESSVPGSEA